MKLNDKSIKKNYGMLGKNDLHENRASEGNNLMGGLGGGVLGKMIGGAMNMLETEIKKEMQKNNGSENIQGKNFDLYINGKRVSPENIKISNKIQEKEKEIKLPENFSKNDFKKFSSLDKKSPETGVRRLSDRIIYEIKVPGLKSIKQVNMTKVNDVFELKLLTEKEAYFKNISINFPLLSYKVEENDLILEFETKE